MVFSKSNLITHFENGTKFSKWGMWFVHMNESEIRMDGRIEGERFEKL